MLKRLGRRLLGDLPGPTGDRIPRDPAATAAPRPVCTGPGRPFEIDRPFVLLDWNLQYSAGRRVRFFYDGGRAVFVDPVHQAEASRGIQAVLAAERADLVLLQEIDRGSDRTSRVDQLPPLFQAARAPWHVSTWYHRRRYVPSPSHRPLGRVDFHLAMLSQAPIQAAQRIPLPLLREPRIRQLFNLRRCLLTAELPIAGSPEPLRVAVTHLSAFSGGDGTLADQVAVLGEWMGRWRPDQPWILAGDFNLLPPGDSAARLGGGHALYGDIANPLEALIPRFRTACADPLAPEARSYLPWGAEQPDRKLDYVFVGGPVEVLDARVLAEHDQLSDHLPLRVELVVRGS